MIRIDDEFKRLLEPLTKEEYAQLEQNIIADGCREPLVIWGDVIVDGHNRHNICTEHDIEYKTTDKEFASRDEAMDWIDKNQLGRRNLSPDQMSLIIGRRYERAKSQGVRNDLTCDQNDQKFGNTSQRIAAEHGVGEATVRRAGKFAEAVDAIKDFAPEIEEKIHSKEKVVKSDVIKAAQMVRDGDEEGAREVLNTGKAARNSINNTTTDSLGNEIPEHLKPVFGGRQIKGWLREIATLTKSINASENPERAYLQKQAVGSAITRLRGVLNNALPYVVCPACGGDGCGKCHDNGFMTEEIYTYFREEQE